MRIVRTCKYRTSALLSSGAIPSAHPARLAFIMRLLNCPYYFASTSVVVVLCAVLPVLSYAASCNTNQNPTCQGDSTLLSICCTWPNICYWSNRNGQPACCPHGTDCRLLGGPAPNQISYVPTPVTQFQQTTLYVTQVSTTTVAAAPVTSAVISSPSTTNAPAGTTFNSVTTNAVIVVTQTLPTSVRLTTINGQFVTVTQAAGAQGVKGLGSDGVLLQLLLMVAGLLANT